MLEDIVHFIRLVPHFQLCSASKFCLILLTECVEHFRAYGHQSTSLCCSTLRWPQALFMVVLSVLRAMLLRVILRPHLLHLWVNSRPVKPQAYQSTALPPSLPLFFVAHELGGCFFSGVVSSLLLSVFPALPPISMLKYLHIHRQALGFLPHFLAFCRLPVESMTVFHSKVAAEVSWHLFTLFYPLLPAVSSVINNPSGRFSAASCWQHQPVLGPHVGPQWDCRHMYPPYLFLDDHLSQVTGALVLSLYAPLAFINFSTCLLYGVVRKNGKRLRPGCQKCCHYQMTARQRTTRLSCLHALCMVMPLTCLSTFVIQP